MDNPGLPFSDTGAKDGFKLPRRGCIRRSMKNADVLLADSSVIFQGLGGGDDEDWEGFYQRRSLNFDINQSKSSTFLISPESADHLRVDTFLIPNLISVLPTYPP